MMQIILSICAVVLIFAVLSALFSKLDKRLRTKMYEEAKQAVAEIESLQAEIQQLRKQIGQAEKEKAEYIDNKMKAPDISDEECQKAIVDKLRQELDNKLKPAV